MAMLAFLPWLTLSKKAYIALHGFELLPYVRGRLPADKDPDLQRALDLVLEPYMDQTNHSVKSATILRLSTHGIINDLTADERDELFAFTELLALAGLASRDFFGHGFPYVNRDDFMLIIQSFSDPAGGVAYDARRRDGSTKGYIPRGSYRVQAPLYVNDSTLAEPDMALLDSLLGFRAQNEWPQYWEAILMFNHANTDSSQVPDHQEAVMMVGAFEMLLGLRSGKEHELAEAFHHGFSPQRDLTVDKCARLSSPPALLERYKKNRSVREAWIRDFFRMRGALSHGATKPQAPSAWSLREHLLLGAYAFPQLVKLALASRKFYVLTKDDRFDVEVFEELVCSPNLFAQVSGRGQAKEWPWDQIRREGGWRIRPTL